MKRKLAAIFVIAIFVGIIGIASAEITTYNRPVAK